MILMETNFACGRRLPDLGFDLTDSINGCGTLNSQPRFQVRQEPKICVNFPVTEERCTTMAKEIRTVCDPAGIPVLEIVKSEDGNVTIFEADDMDNQLQFPASIVPLLIQQLETLK